MWTAAALMGDRGPVMLKLRYLFDNRPLAELLRAGWDTDPEQLPGFRISSNAIYPFMSGGEVSFLRFAPTSEKRVAQVEAELDFIGHLRRAGYGAPEPIPARDGRLVVTEETPWGAYLATAFRKVPGTQLDRGDIDDRIATSYGQALAELHRLSSDHSPTGSRRWSHADALD